MVKSLSNIETPLEFYMSLTEKEKWCIRTYLRKIGRGSLADKLCAEDDNVYMREKYKKLGIDK